MDLFFNCLEKIKNFCLKNKKQILVLLLVFVVAFGVFLVCDYAFAEDNEPDPSKNWSTMKEVVVTILGWIAQLIAGFLGGVAVLLFEIVVQASMYNGYLTDDTINRGWVIIRDICNLAFVVILLIIAFATILRVEKYTYKKLLVKVVIAAILINFSKVIVGLIIDAAQVVMMTFVNGYKLTIGGNLIKGIGMDKIFDFDVEAVKAQGLTMWDVVISIILAVVMLFITVVVIIVYVVVFIGRIIILWMMIILSPFAFLLTAIPDGESYAKQWWSKFMTEVFVGPVLAFFLWLSLYIMSSTGDNEVPGNLNLTREGVAQPEAAIGGGLSMGASVLGTITGMTRFIIAIGLLIGALLIAQKMSTIGGKFAGSATGLLRKWGMGLVKKVSGYRRAERVYGLWSEKRKERSAERARRDYARLAGAWGAAKGVPAFAAGAVGGLARAGVKEIAGETRVRKWRENKRKKQQERRQRKEDLEKERKEREARIQRGEGTTSDYLKSYSYGSWKRRQLRAGDIKGDAQNKAVENRKSEANNLADGELSTAFNTIRGVGFNDKTTRISMGLEMAERGLLTDREQVQQIFDDIGDNGELEKKFKKAMYEKQAHLLYDTSTEEGRNKMSDDAGKKFKFEDLHADAWQGEEGQNMQKVLNKHYGNRKGEMVKKIEEIAASDPNKAKNMKQALIDLNNDSSATEEEKKIYTQSLARTVGSLKEFADAMADSSLKPDGTIDEDEAYEKFITEMKRLPESIRKNFRFSESGLLSSTAKLGITDLDLLKQEVGAATSNNSFKETLSAQDDPVEILQGLQGKQAKIDGIKAYLGTAYQDLINQRSELEELEKDLATAAPGAERDTIKRNIESKKLDIKASVDLLNDDSTPANKERKKEFQLVEKLKNEMKSLKDDLILKSFITKNTEGEYVPVNEVI